MIRATQEGHIKGRTSVAAKEYNVRITDITNEHIYTVIQKKGSQKR
jgi:hypothetical protein